jgi:hypothetical protein
MKNHVQSGANMTSINFPTKKPKNKLAETDRGKSSKSDGRLSASNKGILNYNKMPHQNEQASVIKELGHIVPDKFQRASNCIKDYWDAPFVTEIRDKAFEEICSAVNKIAPEGCGFFKRGDYGWGFWELSLKKS